MVGFERALASMRPFVDAGVKIRVEEELGDGEKI
jgi:hypothetical protein